MKNKPAKLMNFLQNYDLELREKKTVIGFYYKNLQILSLNNFTTQNDEIFLDINFNILKNKKSIFEGTRVNIEKTPTIKRISESGAIALIKVNNIISESKELTEFKEVQENYLLDIAEKDGKQVVYRSNLPTEKHIIQSVFKGGEYMRKGLKVNKNDVVFDLGGNIGCFSIDIFDKAKKIIAFEPEDVNYNFFVENLEINKVENVELIKGAVVGNKDKVRKLYLGKAPYYYSFLVKTNRKPIDVKCYNINKLIQKHNPTKLKVDIEGAELEVLSNITDFKNVNQIVFEYNFDMNGDLKNDHSNFKELKKHLSSHSFDISDLEKDLKSNWNMVFLVNKKP